MTWEFPPIYILRMPAPPYPNNRINPCIKLVPFSVIVKYTSDKGHRQYCVWWLAVQVTDCETAAYCPDGHVGYLGRQETNLRHPTDNPDGESQHDWEVNSLRVLNLTNLYLPKAMGVTPQVLSRSLCRKLADYLTQHFVSNVTSTKYVGYGRQFPAVTTWRWYLLHEIMVSILRNEATAWTEYDLYYLYAVHAGLWDKYHKSDMFTCWQLNVWHKDEFASWDPCKHAQEKDYVGHWFVVQSQMQVPASVIWNRLERCLMTEKGICIPRYP